MTLTATPLETSATADEALRHFAQRDPGRLALSVEGQQVTYAELDAAVDAMAARLLDDLGRGPGFVAVRINAAVPMITASLAVTRAGMSYVPIDPTAPADRVVAVLREVEPGLLLTDVEADRAETWPVPIADPNTYRAEPPAGGVHAKPAEISAVVFTSGSTGTPKGILHSRTHRESMASMIRELWDDYPQPEEIRIGAITVGTVGLADGAAHATLVLGGAFVGYDIRRLGLEPWGEWMRTERISTTALVPTIWRFFAGTLDPSVQFPHLTLLVMVGEASTWEDIAALRRHAPNAHVVNMLAQTEVSMSRFDIAPETPLGAGRLPAGVPIPGRELHILDPDGNPVPTGERGEIVVDTFDCAAGYWKMPEATARTFEPLPDGRTRVHTGDAGRLLPDGSLEHLGRIDHMVKVSGGNRVELGDVEAKLRGLDGVAGAVAVAVPGSDGDLRLMAAVALDGSLADAPTGLQLRAQLSELLPKPMLPDRIYVVDELPTLPGGKVDRRGLADDIVAGRLTAAGGPATGEASPEAARLATVVELYGDVLGRDDVGPDSDFFAFGGDSLRAARLMATLGELVGRNLPVSLLLEDPTPRGLVGLLAREATGAGLLVVIRRGSPGRAPLVLVHDANADVFYARQIVDQLEPDRPILGLRAQTLFRHEPEDTDLAGVAARYLRELRASGYHGPWLIYGYSMGGTIGFEMACQLQAAGDEVKLLALGDAPGPLPADAARHSHWRFRLLRRWREVSSRSPGEAVRHVGWLAARQARYLTNATRRAVKRLGGERPVDHRKEMEAAVFAEGPLAYETMLSFTATHFSEMLFAYRPQRRFDGDALLFKAQSQDDRDANGWRPHVTGAVDVVDVAAPHDAIHSGEEGRQLAGRLCEALRRVQPDA